MIWLGQASVELYFLWIINHGTGFSEDLVYDDIKLLVEVLDVC